MIMVLLGIAVLSGCQDSGSQVAETEDPIETDPPAPPALGMVTLSWQPPTQNADGTPLLDLSGYTIYFGTQSQSYDSEIELDNPGLTTYVVENLVPDTYYFAATAVNSSGMESTFSGEVAIAVN
jgi:hypothetical protein